MNILWLMIAITFLYILGFVIAFIWGTKNSQFDDLQTPAWRILFNDKPDSLKEENGSENNRK